MEGVSSVKQLKTLYEALKNRKKVNLFGPHGVGKTWMAKRVSDRCTRDNSDKLFDFTLWVFMCRQYNTNSLSESIARQLCLLPTVEEWEVEDDSKGQKDDDETVNTENLIQKLRKKLDQAKILLVLDDALDDALDEGKFWSVWKEMLPDHDDDNNLVTLLISRSSRQDQDKEFLIEVKALPKSESDLLLEQKLDSPMKESEEIRSLGEKFMEKNDTLPGTIMKIAKVLSYFKASMLKKELEEDSKAYNVNKLLCMKHNMLPIGVLKDLCWRSHHFFHDSGSVHFSELITYWILEGYLGFGSMTKLYEKGHGVLLELMDCGMLKRQEGGYVFMDKSLLEANDLRQCVNQIVSLGLATVFTSENEGFGRITQGGYVFMDKSLLEANDLRQCVNQIASLGLATVFTSENEGFGRITHEDGMLKTPRTGKKHSLSSEERGQNLSALLLDGTHFSEKVLMGFLEPEKELQVVALFNPTIKALPKPLTDMKKLRVLVLRGCEFLQDVKLPLPDLVVLEISGGISLKTIPGSFFTNMLKLQSLNLSQLLIKYLPSSFYSLTDLRWLIVKDCRNLEKLESISKLEHLMVVDLSGNTALDSVDKNFLKFKNLQSLNLSNTMVPTTPLLKNIGELTHLMLRDCKTLCRLRGLTKLTSLQTLDLSGSKDFEEFHDSSLESLSSLETLNLSGTALDRLPSNISNPRYLYLKNCLQLEQISCIESLVDIEVLDLSGSTNLNEIEEEFFNCMTCLRVLNVSKTNLSGLPSLSNLLNLRKLFVSGCTSLVELPSLESLEKLEILDVSLCNSLKDINTPTFEKMTHLQMIDLSETKIESLPSLSNQTNLRQLVLKNCTALKNFELNISLSNLEELNLCGVASLPPNGAEFVKDMSKLQVLDLSFTPIDHLPSMSKLKNLTHLSVAGCSSLKTVPDLNPLTKLEVLDLSGSSVTRLPNLVHSRNLRKLLLKDCSIVEDDLDVKVNDILGPTPKIPQGISGLIHLDYFEFPNIKDVEGVDTEQDQWHVCRLSDVDKPPLFLSGSQFLQILKKDPSPHGPFHLCAVPLQDGYLRELVFGHVYLQTSQFAPYKQNRSLQIRGFNESPKGVENVISLVDLVFLIDNKFETLVSGSNPSVFSKLKGCWIERCDELVTIFNEEEEKDEPKPGFCLENLGISNNCGLKSIYNGKKLFERFNSLKSLYLNGCPKLTTVFPSSWLPETLKVLHIKHCDNIVSLFATAEGKHPNLETLHLWELPKLETIGVSFPHLETLKIWECPKVMQMEENFEFAKGLKTLWISGAIGLKSLYDGNHDTHNLMNLETLKLESCPMLRNVMSSNLPLGNIKSIEIRSCEKLKTLFEHSSSVRYELPFLCTLRLEDLPMLESVGAECPKLDRNFKRRDLTVSGFWHGNCNQGPASGL